MLNIILLGFIFVGISFGAWELYQINQELQIVKFEKTDNEKIAEKKIKNLNEKLAEEAITNKKLAENTEFNPVEIAKNFNKEYGARKNTKK